MPATTAAPQAQTSSRPIRSAWPLERIPFLRALANCPSSLVLRRYFGVKGACER